MWLLILSATFVIDRFGICVRVQTLQDDVPFTLQRVLSGLVLMYKLIRLKIISNAALLTITTPKIIISSDATLRMSLFCRSVASVGIRNPRVNTGSERLGKKVH